MGFDPDILVRLSWAGVPLLFYPVKVKYPKDGISHFRMVRDNIRISCVLARLFRGMIPRLPLLLFRKPRRADTADGSVPSGSGHWSRQKEKAGSWQLALFFFLFRVLPPFLLSLCAYPVGFCYFLFSRTAREESRRFLGRAAAFRGQNGRSGSASLGGGGGRSAAGHIIAFALSLVEKAEAWGGRVPFKRIHFQNDDVTALIDGLERGTGAALLCSHLGNTELLRALAGFRRTGVSRDISVTSVADFEVTPFFNRMLAKLNPRSSLKIVSANAAGPDFVITLQEETARGGLAVIHGDRTSAHTGGKFFPVPFLGKTARFPVGPFLLAALLEAPVYAVFALRRKDLSPLPDYDMHVRRLGAGNSAAGRRERYEAAENMARHFAALLEDHCLQHPFQWYNFYDFWAEETGANAGAYDNGRG
jgi:predicted LPLAT superfamily acyltransferase